ncbi:PD40 domain-containing protein [Xanthovirga aplysinae]|uniref:PD40 domain-containing protein n=1 Tax=Xanthovirga aplysinae TaxID=2529853 RepID=UPI0012BD61F0|nr:PD40 domain-containing protein [Xanthovirga aplysinae]MTI31753.1 translocation protein TolB [Xanthovirga aplysinae]
MFSGKNSPFHFISFILIGFILCNSGFAQTPVIDFGKNRIQYKNFDWRYYSTDNFEVYYYDKGQSAARQAAEFMEEEYERMTEVLGYAPYSKSKIFLYNSVSDLQQSNVGIDGEQFTVSGQTNFVKLQVEVANPGTITGLKEQLVLKTARMLINDMMYGGNLTDIIQNAYLLTLPDWFMDGAALYLAKGWSVEMDDHLRELLSKKRVKKLSKFTGQEAALVGQSLWNYMAEQYGQNSINNILNLTRIIRNEENSIESTLGVPYKQFIYDWNVYYQAMGEKIKGKYNNAPPNKRLRKRNRKGITYNKVKISPDGQFLAYSENNKGKYRVFIKNLANGRRKQVFSGGYKTINQDTDPDIPLLAWKDAKTLGIISVYRGRNYLWLYETTSSSSQRILLDRFEQVKDFSFSSNGNVAVMSADSRGQNDLYLVSVNRTSIRRLTNDLFDNLNPRFIPNSRNIVFSSNRTTDSLRVNDQKVNELKEYFNLYMMDADTTKERLVKITNNIYKNINPIPVNESTIYYLSDEKGVVNVYKYDLDKGLYNQVSDFSLSLEDYDINYQTSSLAFTSLYRGKGNVFYIREFELQDEVFTPQTTRQEIYQSRFLKEYIEERRQEKEEEGVNPADTLFFGLPKDSLSNDLGSQPTDIINTDDLIFDKETEEEEEKEENFFMAQLLDYKKESPIEGPLNYTPRFSANNIVTTMKVDPLFGLGLLFEVEMNDMLENHKFHGGLMPVLDFQSGKIFAEYSYLKYFTDFHFRYERESLFLADEDLANLMQRYILNRFEVGASLPLSVSTRISGSPFFTHTMAIDLDPNKMVVGAQREPIDNNMFFAGIKFQLVMDNTLTNGLNMLEGTRLSAIFEHHQATNEKNGSFSNINFDFRHYQKIHREFVLATRVFYGQFFGKNKQEYLLGGMDNWLFNEFDDKNKELLAINEDRDNTNLLFTEFVTSLRGFDYNTFHGNSAFLANVELRLPVVRYFYRGPIESNFFRNLEIIGFFDIGSAWSGGSPFSEDNSLKKEVIKRPGSPFEATLKNFQSPWLMGYGTGVRTALFGYYMKFDVAWPYFDYEIGDPKFYFTLGYDF